MELNDSYTHPKSEDMVMGHVERLSDEGILPHGELDIIVKEFHGTDLQAGEVVDHRTYKNLIVNRAREALAKLISAGTPSEVLTLLKLGDGHHAPGDILTPIPPVVTETALENLTYSHAIDSYNYPIPTTVEFVTTILRSEGNGSGYSVWTEFGLFSVSGMFSIKSAPALVKNSDREIIFRWRIVF